MSVQRVLSITLLEIQNKKDSLTACMIAGVGLSDGGGVGKRSVILEERGLGGKD